MPKLEESERENVRRRFALLESHADLPRLMEAKIDVSSAPFELPILALSLLGLAVVGVVLSVTSSLLVGPLAIVPLLLVVIAVFGIANSLLANRALQRAPVTRVAALVVAEHTKITSRVGAPAETRTFATLEFSDGSRHEVGRDDSLDGHIASGDMGVAFLRAGLLIDFRRIPV